MHHRVVFDNERSLFRRFPQSRYAGRIVRVTHRLSCHRVGFSGSSARLRGLFGAVYAAAARRVDENEPAHRYEVVFRRLGLRTSLRTRRFVRVRAVRTLPGSTRSEASADGIGGIYATVPMELAGKFAFVGIVFLVGLVAVETQHASFHVSCRRDVGNHRVHEEVSSFLSVDVVAEDDDGEHGIRIRIVHVGIDIRASALDDDGFLSRNRKHAVIRPAGYALSENREVATGVSVNRSAVREFAEIVEVDVFRSDQIQRRSTIGPVFRRHSAGHVVSVLLDLGFQFLTVDGFRVDFYAALEGCGKGVVPVVGNRAANGDFLSFRNAVSEGTRRYGGGGVFESRHSCEESEVFGVVTRIAETADIVVGTVVGEVGAESEFPESVSVRIGLYFYVFRHRRESGEGGESVFEGERNLLERVGVFRVRSKIAPNPDIRERSEIVRIMECEPVVVKGERAVDGVVLENEFNGVPGVVGKDVEILLRSDFYGRLEGEVVFHSGFVREIHADRAGERGVRVRSGTDVAGRTTVDVAQGRFENVFETQGIQAYLVVRIIRVSLYGRHGRLNADGIDSVDFLGRVVVVRMEGISADVARVPVSVPIVVNGPVGEIVISKEGRRIVEFPNGSDLSNAGNRADDVSVRVFQLYAVIVRIREVGDHGGSRRGEARIGIERGHRRDDRYRNGIGEHVSGIVLERDLNRRFALPVRVVFVDVTGEVAEIFGGRRRIHRLVEKVAVFKPGDGVVADSGRARIGGSLHGIRVSTPCEKKDFRFFREGRIRRVETYRVRYRRNVSGDIANMHVDGFQSFSRGTSRSGGDVEYAGTRSKGFPGSDAVRIGRAAEFYGIHVETGPARVARCVRKRGYRGFGVQRGRSVSNGGLAVVVADFTGYGQRSRGGRHFFIIRYGALGTLEGVAGFYRRCLRGR